jgi:hypothetical protein
MCALSNDPLDLSDEMRAKYPTMRCSYCGASFSTAGNVVPEHQAERSQAELLVELFGADGGVIDLAARSVVEGDDDAS